MPGPLAVDPITSAAFALCSRPGAYAVLVGSGVSSAAGVPNGWQVLERLVGEVASLENSDAGVEPMDWFREQFGVKSTYSGVVEALGVTEAERQALIVRALYGEDGPPDPTPGHRALARLASGGWIRIILTTNFDRLIETALTDARVDFTVLSTPEAVQGGLPLVHAGHVVIKLHGDQSDQTILNTDSELAAYHPAIDQLLDRVFDEYGLIVCGWSADHDTALRAALDRSTNRRFTTYWAARSTPSELAAGLVSRRDAELITGGDADAFFGRLADACETLTATRRNEPISVAVDVAIVKRELAGGQVAISLHDRLRREIERVRALEIFAPTAQTVGDDQIHVVDEMIGETERLVALVATAAYWGDAETDRWWVGEIGRMAARQNVSRSLAVLDRPRLPALVMAWSGGVAAIAAERDDLVESLFGLPFVSDPFRRESEPLPPLVALSPQIFHTGDETGRLYRILRPAFVEHLALGHDAFVDAWERLQLLLYLGTMEARVSRRAALELSIDGMRIDGGGVRAEPVPFGWMVAEIARLGEDHPLLKGGLFSGSIEVLEECMETSRSKIVATAEEMDTFAANGGALPGGRHYPMSSSDDPDEVFGVQS